MSEIPLYWVEAVDRALGQLKRALAEMRAAAARADAGPGYDGRPLEAPDGQGRLQRTPAVELSWKKGLLSDGQYLAALRYMIDVGQSTIAPLQTARYEEPAITPGAGRTADAALALSATTPRGAKRVAGAHMPLSDLKLDALQRVNRVHQRVLHGTDSEWRGADLAERRACLAIVDQVVVRDFTIVAVAAARELGNRNRVARRLKLALDVMAKHYGTRDAGGVRSMVVAEDVAEVA